MGDYGKCSICGEDLMLHESKDVGGAHYNILRCKKCRRQVIRSG